MPACLTGRLRGLGTIDKAVVVHMLSAFGNRISKGEVELLLEQKGVCAHGVDFAHSIRMYQVPI